MVWTYALVSVTIVSLLSLIGIVSLGIKINFLKRITLYLVSLSAGALLGDVFFHLLPELAETSWLGIVTGSLILGGITFGMIIEKIIHRRHCHLPTTAHHPHPFAVMNLVGDFVHNFIDGLIIGSSYLVSIEVGIATTFAVILHEIPQEIGDFGVLIHGGFTPRKALLINFLTALSAIVWVMIVLFLHNYVDGITAFFVPFAIGNFIYIAGSDLIPEMHKETAIKNSLIQLLRFILGIGVMFLLLGLE